MRNACAVSVAALVGLPLTITVVSMAPCLGGESGHAEAAFGLDECVSVNDGRFSGLDQYVQDAIERWQVPGLAIAVVKDGEIVVARGFGVCEVGSNRPVTKDTVFSIASCTKSFTAACVGMLVDEGRLNWDDPVKQHLPDFAVSDAYITEHVTLRDLLCHRTGLVRGDLLFVKGDLDRAEIFRRLRFLDQTAPFRTKVTYNNVMYSVLGEVVARVSGISWEQFVTQRVFEPLELSSTTVARASVPPERLAVRHRPYDDQILPLRTPMHDDLVAPAGAIHSTVVDMAHWLSFHLREGEHSGHRLLHPDTVREMHALHQSIPIRWHADANIYRANLIGTGLGWFVRDYRGHKVVQHGGGWGADTAIVPEEKLAVVVLSNLDWNGLVSMLVYDVIDAYLVGPQQAWSREGKWTFWQDIGGPQLYRERTEQRAQLDLTRVEGTSPSLPLEEYAGTYESDLYGRLQVHHAGRLSVQFGDHRAELSHWQDDMFYGNAVVEPFLDWLVKFQVDRGKSVSELEIVHVGWKDPDERHIFRCVEDIQRNDRSGD